jgi:hypothetical protein
MKLSDVRKLAIRQQVRIHFRLSDGKECVVMEDGIARIPGLRDALQVSLDDEFAAVTQVEMETVVLPPKTVAARTVLRAELEKLTSSHSAGAVADDHDE